jgi:predicted acyltransferase (DUF342 family)
VEAGEEISARSIEVGGLLRSRKATAEERVEVGGSINTVEGVSGRVVEIGRRGEVRGPMRADQIIIGKEARAGSIYGREVLMESGAQAENVYGESVTIESHCQIRGEVQYTNELRVGDNVSLAKTPTRVDKLPA